MPKYTEEKRNECKLIFDLLTSNNSDNLFDQNLLADLLRVNGAIVSDKQINDIYDRLGSKFTFEKFEREFSQVYQNQGDEYFLISQFKELDSNDSGKISKNVLIDLMQNYDNPLSSDEISSILELANPDGNDQIDYKTFAKKLMS